LFRVHAALTTNDNSICTFQSANVHVRYVTLRDSNLVIDTILTTYTDKTLICNEIR